MGDSILRKDILLGLGNPLLDITAFTDKSILEKYGLKPNDAILAEDNHMPIYNELIDKYPVEYTAGGACQNAMRVAQWILPRPKMAAFMGCIGRDKFGEILEDKAKEAGVDTFYQYHETVPTGTCAVVVTEQGANRSLCANLSAANCFSMNHIEQPQNKLVIEKSDFFYITSFFLTVSPPTIMEVAQHAAHHNKVFLMNLSAPFLCEFFKTPMMEAMPYVDILFGNEQEAVKFSEIQEFGTEIIEDIALKISQLPKKNEKRSRIVIITQGQDSIVVAEDGKIKLFPVVNLKSEEIIDTNGAGDAFVGGFLSQYILGRELKVCIECGVYAATEIIKRSGCTFPEKMTFKCN